MAERKKPSREESSGKGSKVGKNGRDEEFYEDESVFERRREWLRETLADADGCLDGSAHVRAMRHAASMRRTPLQLLDPGGAAPKRGYELSLPRGVKARARRTGNPRPRSSLGFVGPAVEIGGGDRRLRGAVLKVALDRKERDVDLSTVRVFRFDASSGEWALVRDSGVSVEGGYAWAHVNRPGTYALVGLPSNQWLRATIMGLETYHPWINAARELGRLPEAIDRICRLILCDGLFADAVRDPAVANRVGLPPFGQGDPANICERCIGLDPPTGGLPEVEIIRELPQVALIDAFVWYWPWWCTSWVSQGPVNVNGRIKSLAIHPTNGNIVYAGAANGGVWKTMNGGATWSSTMRLELSMAIGGLAVAPSSPSIVYAATGEHTPGWNPSHPGVGVYKTTNSGGDWDLMGPIPSTRCSRVLVHPTNPNIVYVAGSSGLHRSDDGGATWTTVRTGTMSDALLDPNAPNTLYVGIRDSGIFKSVDGGASWNQLSNGVPIGSEADWIKLGMGLNGADGTAFLAAKMGLDSGLIFVSEDAGNSWTQLPGTHHGVSYNEWTSMIEVSPADQDVLFAGGVGYSRSSNGGASFNSIGGTHSDHHQIVFDPNDSDILYMATDGGVYRSTNDGVDWVLQSSGLVATQLYSIGVSQTNPVLLGGGTQDQGIIRSDGSTTWAGTGAGNEGGFFIVDPNDADNVYVTPWNHNLRRSTNGAVNWTTILTGLGDPAPDVRHLAIRPGNSNHLICVAGGDVFRSTNQGNNWSSVFTTSGQPRQVAYAPSNGTIVYVATSSGRVYRSGGAGASGSWAEPYAEVDRPPSGSINALVVGWTDPDYVAIGYAGGTGPRVYVSEDGGAHWHDAGGALATDALPAVPVTSLVFHPYTHETIYAATSIGVFRTRDGGDSWEPFDDGMPRIVTSQLVLRRNTRDLYVSSMGRGAYRRRI